MRINARFDAAPLLLRMRNGQKRLAYASVNAINKTAKRIQREAQERVFSEFTIRKPDFMKRMAAVIKPFASVKDARPFAEVAVGDKPGLLLSVYERGGERKPRTANAKMIAVPVVGGPARESFRDTVPTELRMRRLNFSKTKTGKRRKAVTETGTYLVPGTGIFQHLAGSGSRLVYFFRRDQRIKPRLRWEETARREGDRWLAEYFEQEVTKAIAHDKGRSI